MKRFHLLPVCALAVLYATTTAGAGRGSSPAPWRVPVPLQSADVAKAWGDAVTQVIKNEKLSPPVASRLIGYWGVALYESLAPGMPGCVSLRGQLNGLRLPRPLRFANPFLWIQCGLAGRVHWPLAASEASDAVLRGLLPNPSAPTLTLLADLLGDWTPPTSGPGSVPADTQANSVAWGESVAATILEWASRDGYDVLNACAFTPPTGPGLWVPTAPGQVPLQPCWGEMRTFVLRDGEECAPPPPPAYSETPGSPFHAAAQEVHDVGVGLTAEQTEIALFWADGGGTVTPPGHWVSIVGQVIDQYDLSLAQAAEAYARVGLSVADAFIACWNAKYRWNLLRPVTYIKAHIDAAWAPLIGTPPFPTYTSGHSSQSGASSYILAAQLGEIPFTDSTHAPAMAPRSFSGFTEAGLEAMVSRLYGGIHFTFDNEAGFASGQCIGEKIDRRVRFRRR